MRVRLSRSSNAVLKAITVRQHTRTVGGKPVVVHQHQRTGDRTQPDLPLGRTATAPPAPSTTGPLQSTEDMFRDSATGEWAPERARLHREIVERALAGKPQQAHPTFILVGGGTAAGKSTLVKGGAVTLPAGHVLIDPDAVKESIPEYGKLKAAKDHRAAAHVHEESSHVAGLILQQAGQRGHHVVLDATGDSGLDKLAKKVQAGRGAGAKVRAVYATVPTDEAIKRADERAKKTARAVPHDYIREVHAQVSRVFPAAVKAGLFDHAELYDTSTSPPQLIFRFEDGKEHVLDRARWEQFLAKGQERMAKSIVRGPDGRWRPVWA